MNALQQFIQSKPCGFLRETDMPELIRLDRLCPVLIRCGGCRLTCAAQDAAHIIKAIEAAADYVRDVSFPVGSLERAAAWRDERNHCQQCGTAVLSQSQPFNEADCGGVFDGSQVTSDADPGL